MSLLEHSLHKQNRLYSLVLIPLILVFLLIKPYISLFLLLILVARFFYTKAWSLTLKDEVENSGKLFNQKLENTIHKIKESLAITSAQEAINITEDFPGIYLDFLDGKNEYIVIFRDKTRHFKSLQEIRPWLESQ